MAGPTGFAPPVAQPEAGAAPATSGVTGQSFYLYLQSVSVT